MIYLLHFQKPYKHARHYIGYTDDLKTRLARHRAGNGARLIQVINQAGIDWRLVRLWKGSRTDERRLKNIKNAPRLCPICNPQGVLKPGTQIVYTPLHAGDDIEHRDAERGFVTLAREIDAFCRYWRRDGSGLRTTTCSELTPIDRLVVYKTERAPTVRRLMREIKEGKL